MADPTVMAALITMPFVREVLKQIADSRLIRFGELRKRTESQGDRDQLKDALETLEDLRLVDVRKAPIEDLETLLITAEGLGAARRVGR